MQDDTVLKFDRSDVVDTSGMKTILFRICTAAAREAGAVPEEMAAVIGRLVLGQAVPHADLDRWKIGAMRMYSMDELAAEGPPSGVSNVGPMLSLDPVEAQGMVQRVETRPKLRLVTNQPD